MNRTTGYARDSAGYVTTLTNPDSTTQVSMYSSDGFHVLLTFKDENNHTTTYTDDTANGHILTITNALSEVTHLRSEHRPVKPVHRRLRHSPGAHHHARL